MIWKQWKSVFGIAVATLMLVGCNGSGGGNASKTENKVETSMDLSLAALYAGKSTKSTASKSLTAANKILTGELLAENTTTGTSETFTWSAYLDESDLNITSNKTIALEPGDYRFSLLLSDENFQYAGEAVYEIVDGGQHSIPLTIKPIIGDTVVNVSVIGELAGYKFQYQTSELTDITAPKLGVVVDGGAEQMFTINPSTGLTETYLNLTNGSHTINLNLYDANVQIGRSVPEQEAINVVAGEPFSIDLIALHGEAEFIIDVTGGTATVTANIPQEVIDEIGLSNLQVILLLSDNNATVKEEAMTLTTENNITTGSVTLSDMQFGTYAMQLKFNDLSDTSVPVASCLMDGVVLDKTGSTVNCTLTLQKREIIGGNLLATVGINVFNTGYEPIAGAKVYANDDLIGLTGSGSFGTKGYLKIYQVAGDTVFRAEDDTYKGDVNTSLNPLDVKNFDIILDQKIAYLSCKDILDSGNSTGDGVYLIDPDGDGGEEPFDVYCDMETDGGGWTLITKAKRRDSTNLVAGPVFSDQLPANLTQLSRINNEDVKYSLWPLFTETANSMMVKVGVNGTGSSQNIIFKAGIDKALIQNNGAYSFGGYAGISCISGSCPNVNIYALYNHSRFSILRIGQFEYPNVHNYYWGYETGDGWGRGSGGTGGASFWIR